MQGNVTVRGYDGSEVVIESSGGQSRRQGQAPPGMRRIPTSGGVEAVEENNTIRISTDGPMSHVNLNVQVPRATSVQVRGLNSAVIVEGVEGEVEAHSTNGKVSVTNVVGPVVAHSLNGGIVATITRLTEPKPMSFSTLNGNIDVTLPADIRARMKFKSDNGEVFTDFDVKPETSPKPVVQDNREGGRGRYRVSVDRTTYATSNGGGPDISFTTMNGQIYVRRK
jgi:DUF4097 and DUF4098 domain-containing protein YvlB